LKKKKYNYLSIPVIYIMAGIFFSCQNTMEEIESANDGSILPSQTIKNGSFDYTEKGKLLHRIASGEMNQFENENLEASVYVRVEMFDAAENVEAVLTSKEGTYLKSKNTVIARDSVRLKNAEGDVLMTEELTLYQDSNLIVTDFPIEIHKGDNVIFGEGLRADASFKKYTILNPANSKIVVPEREKTNQK
tara:strand:- start:6714 stop:7286 length:573 start_codon:yes stop_codon:yes gene_type:complete